MLQKLAQQFQHPRGRAGRALAYLMNLTSFPSYRFVSNWLASNGKGNILEIGFGNGHYLNKFARQMEENTFYGLDPSATMVQQAKKKRVPQENLYLKKATLTTSRYPSQLFKQIYTVNTLYFWPDLREGLTEIYRLLEEEGQFLNVAFTEEWLDQKIYQGGSFQRYSRLEIETMARKVGFRAVKWQTLWSEKIAVFALIK